jgi:hypothetical protein
MVTLHRDKPICENDNLGVVPKALGIVLRPITSVIRQVTLDIGLMTYLQTEKWSTDFFCKYCISRRVVINNVILWEVIYVIVHGMKGEDSNPDFLNGMP